MEDLFISLSLSFLICKAGTQATEVWACGSMAEHVPGMSESPAWPEQCLPISYEQDSQQLAGILSAS